MIIDASYFVGALALPNLNKAEQEASLEQVIDQYEKAILTELLGYELYTEFIAGIAVGSPVQKWLDLRDGKEYTLTFEGIDYLIKWNGLKNTGKISLLAYFVYYWYRRNFATLTSGIGEVSSHAENAEKALSIYKMAAAFNNGVDLYGMVPDDFSQGNIYRVDSGCYNFISTNESDYDNWIFTQKKYINEFSL